MKRRSKWQVSRVELVPYLIDEAQSRVLVAELGSMLYLYFQGQLCESIKSQAFVIVHESKLKRTGTR
jgi:hypothetical protein